MKHEDNELECAICERGYTKEESQPERPNICCKCYEEELNNQSYPL